ncbi:MAG: MerR family transcriptional regulator [Actinomycetes bacterium]
MNGLITIGRFANLTDLSPRLLRKLDHRGLLSPAHVDPDTRYRYYDYGQIRRANLIRLCRQLGIPLDEIGELVLADDLAALRPLLEEHRARIGRRLAEQARALELLEQELGRSDQPLAYECFVKDVPALLVTGARGSAARVHPHDPWGLERAIELAGDVVVARLAEYATEPAGRAVIVYDLDFEEGDDMHFEVCVPVQAPVPDGGGARCFELPAARLACTTHAGAYETLWNAYAELRAWIADHGYKVTGPTRETGLVDDSDTPEPAGWVTELGLPIAS